MTRGAIRASCCAMAEFPTKDAILQWIEENPEATKRDLAKAFGIRGAAKIDFKALLKAGR